MNAEDRSNGFFGIKAYSVFQRDACPFVCFPILLFRS